jgi:hypothetical protein
LEKAGFRPLFQELFAKPTGFWEKLKSICLTCYWAYPKKYDHIAMTQIRIYIIDLFNNHKYDIIPAWEGERKR